MLPLTLAIITRNEEARLARAIQSVGPVAELLVLDSGSTDKTVELAQALGARVLCCDWPGYGAQKNRALAEAQQEWVLSLDADEALSDSLRKSLEALFEEGPAGEAYAVLRQNHWKGKRLRHGCYGPSWKTRLVRKGCGSWVGGILHEELVAKGPVKRLSGVLDHWPYADEAEFLATSEAYAALFASKSFEEGRRAHWWDVAFRPSLHFVKSVLLKGGFMEGKEGWTLARLGAREVGLKWRSLRVLQAGEPLRTLGE